MIVLVFSFAYGYTAQIPLGTELMIAASVLSIVGFGFYVGYKSPVRYHKRLTCIYLGTSFVGIGIWVAVILMFRAAGLEPQITTSIGGDYFAVTTLIICLALGAFIGDLTGKNREAIGAFIGKFKK